MTNTVHYARATGQYIGAIVSEEEIDLENNYFTAMGCVVVPSAPATTAWFWDFENLVWYLPPPTPEEVAAANEAMLKTLQATLSAQRLLLTNRIQTINDAIELEMATDAEIAELPIRQAQLLEWKRYGVYLGRVTSQEGWSLVVVWPEPPPLVTDL